MIELPSYEISLDCFRSAEYHAKQFLERVGEVELLIIGGYDGPQPA